MKLTASDIDHIIVDGLDDIFQEIDTKARLAGLTDAETLALIVSPDIRDDYAQWIEAGQ